MDQTQQQQQQQQQQQPQNLVDLSDDMFVDAVSAITLPEVFHDVNTTMRELNDVDIQAQFTLNQSRAEEITMREDFVTADEGFGYMGFEQPPDIMRDASAMDQSLDHPNLIFNPDTSGRDPEKDKEQDSRLEPAQANTSALDLEAPIRDDGFGGNFGQDIMAGGLFEEQPLPEGWEMRYYCGRQYFLHHKTHTTQWERPTGQLVEKTSTSFNPQPQWVPRPFASISNQSSMDEMTLQISYLEEELQKAQEQAKNLTLQLQDNIRKNLRLSAKLRKIQEKDLSDQPSDLSTTFTPDAASTPISSSQLPRLAGASWGKHQLGSILK